MFWWNLTLKTRKYRKFMRNAFAYYEVEDQDEQIMGILKYLTEWLVNHILYVDGQIPKG